MSETQPAKIADILVEVQIDATPEKVWQALTSGIGDWWPAEFYGGGIEGDRAYHLEPTPGGRMYESWGTGGGLLWGQVASIDPGKRLQVVGSSFPQWGGPSTWFGTWDLSESDGGCKLRFTESSVGKIGEGSGEEKGWTWLFGGALKAHVEGRPCPEWSD